MPHTNGDSRPAPDSLHDTLWRRQTIPPKGKPHGWIQWKGTDVCMDLRCECGELTHIDAMFAYAVRCRKCGRSYMVNGHVEMVPMTPEEAARWDQEGNCEILTTDD